MLCMSQEESHWERSGSMGLNISQSSFSNWASGGSTAFGLNFQSDYQANYQHGRNMWQNRLELAYGFNSEKGDRSQKTQDKIYLSTLYGYQVKKYLYLGGSFDFRTQFANGFNYDSSPLELISQFMSPGYLTVGAGLIWKPKPYFSLVFNLISWRGTFVLDDALSDAGAYGVDPGDKYRTDFGANLKADFNYWLMKNVNLYSRLELYSNYLDKPLNVDVLWDIQLNLVVNEWISVKLNTSLLYDDDVLIKQDDGRMVHKVQFKEILGVGLQYTF